MMYVCRKRIRFIAIIFSLLSTSLLARPFDNNEVDIDYDSSVSSKNYKNGERTLISGSICLNKRVRHGKTHCSKLSNKKYEIVATFPDNLTEANGLTLSGSKSILSSIR